MERKIRAFTQNRVVDARDRGKFYDRPIGKLTNKRDE